jgi:hypothetical protein
MKVHVETEWLDQCVGTGQDISDDHLAARILENRTVYSVDINYIVKPGREVQMVRQTFSRLD